ncbi:ImmA/IrrE family metallo-endopeptidase [Corynebacterium diphtheriae]
MKEVTIPVIDALIDVAESHGYRVRWHKAGPKAAWIPHLNAISLRVGMDDAQTLCALAHELGHAYYGDPPGHVGKHERRADEFAARLLISPVEYRIAENLHDSNTDAIASELGVTPWILDVWKRLYQQGRIQPESCLSSA